MNTVEISEAVDTYGPEFAAYADNVGHEYASVEDFEDSFRGEWDSEKDFAYQLAEDIDLFHGLPDDHAAVIYFDWDYWTRDLFLTDFYSITTPDYNVWVFRNI